MFIQSSGEAVKCSWNRPILEGNRTHLDTETPLPLHRWWWNGAREGSLKKKRKDDSVPILTDVRLLSEAQLNKTPGENMFPRESGVR